MVRVLTPQRASRSVALLTTPSTRGITKPRRLPGRGPTGVSKRFSRLGPLALRFLEATRPRRSGLSVDGLRSSRRRLTKKTSVATSAFFDFDFDGTQEDPVNLSQSPQVRKSLLEARDSPGMAASPSPRIPASCCSPLLRTPPTSWTPLKKARAMLARGGEAAPSSEVEVEKGSPLQARKLGHELAPLEQGQRVAVVGDGWGAGVGGYEAVVTESDNFTYTVVSIGGDESKWEETHVLKENCITVGQPESNELKTKRERAKREKMKREPKRSKTKTVKDESKKQARVKGAVPGSPQGARAETFTEELQEPCP